MTNWCTIVKGDPSTTYGTYHVMYNKFIRRDGTAPVVLVHHPHASSADAMIDIVNAPGFWSVGEYFAMNGYIVVWGDFADSSLSSRTAAWGNDVNQAAITNARTIASQHGGSTSKKMVLVGFSMGGCATMGYAGRYPGNVAAVIGIIPALDLVAYDTPGVDGPSQSFPTIDAAYGGTYSDASQGSTHNPQTMAAAGAYNTMPIQLWWADADTLAPYALVKKFYDAVLRSSSSAPITMNRIPGSGNGHTDSSAGLVPKTTMLNFAKTYLT